MAEDRPGKAESAAIPIPEIFQDRGLTVVRADPAIHPLVLLNSPETSGSVSDVARRNNLLVAINAAMFQKDYATSIGYMRSFNRINNPRFHPRLKGFLLFHPKNTGSPPVKIAGKQEIENYNTAFQSYRMWDPEEGILWKRGQVYRQIGLAGVDKHHRILFFYHPQPIDVHDLVAQIIAMDLNLTGLLYLDGGFHGSLYLDPQIGRSWNTWISLPNLIGINYQVEAN